MSEKLWTRPIKYAAGQIQKSDMDQWTDDFMKDIAEEEMQKSMNKAIEEKGMEFMDARQWDRPGFINGEFGIPPAEWQDPFPYSDKNFNTPVKDALGFSRGYYYSPYFNTAGVPMHPTLVDWSVLMEEITHGDMEKISRDPWLPHALYTDMYYPGHFKDSYVPESTWGDYGYTPPNRDINIFEGLEPKPGEVSRTALPPLWTSSPTVAADDMTTMTNIGGPSLLDLPQKVEVERKPGDSDAMYAARKKIAADPNYNLIANNEISDLQGMAQTDFDMEKEASRNHINFPELIEEMVTKDLVQDNTPMSDFSKDMLDWSKMTYAQGFFENLRKLENDYNKYLALTGPLRDRSTPSYATEVQMPLFQGSVVDHTDQDYRVKPEDSDHIISSKYGNWPEIPVVTNPFPEYAKFGGPKEFWNKFLKPMSHEQWWSGHKAGSKFQPPGDQYLVEKGDKKSHVNEINKHDMLPYYLDYLNSDYAYLDEDVPDYLNPIELDLNDLKN